MTEKTDRYEVIFMLDPVVTLGLRATFRWSWVGIGADGRVTARGIAYATLGAAVDAARDYRSRHGGGEIAVNIHRTSRTGTSDATVRDDATVAA